MAEDSEQLEGLRSRIDALDHEIVELLNERAAVVVEVGKLKRESGGAIYAPAREAKVLERVLNANHGPLSDRCIEAVYRELMSGSFALERPLRIGYLGPQGSDSHTAARAHFGSSVDFEDMREVSGVFTEVVRGHIDYGLVPIENSTGGGIVETMDAFRDRVGNICAYAEVQLAIRHNLLANCAPAEVRTVFSQPDVFAQCRGWVRTQYPQAELVSVASGTEAAERVRQVLTQDPTSGAAAIGSRLVGEKYDLKVLFESIEDDPNNLTRFLVLASEKAKPTGDDKTSIMFTTERDAGTLVKVLNVFADAGVNLTHIDKRPLRRQNWAYTFFVDAEGHMNDAAFAEVVKRAQAACREFDVLGSYPISRRVL